MQFVLRLRLPDVAALVPKTPRAVWTLIGCLAIPLWASWPLLAALTTSTMPLMQYLAVIFASGAVALFLAPKGPVAVRSDRPQVEGWAKSSRLLAAVMVGLGLLVSDILFILAFRHISVAQANLILYLWPVMVVAICVPLGLATLRRTHVGGILLGLLGAALVIGGGDGAFSWTGVALATGGGLAWAGYVVFRIWQGEQAPDALALGLTLSAAVATALHLAFEATVVPSLGALAGTILVGIIPLALGNLAWDHGVRKGDRVLLATMAYATPLIAAMLLVAFGLAAATPNLLLGAVLIVAAGIVASS
jgi:drug/metabolite transporter (DMT)-like permease